MSECCSEIGVIKAKPIVIEKEERKGYSRFVWSCGCILIRDGDTFKIHSCSSDCPVIARGKQVAEYYGIKSVTVAPKYEKPLLELQDGMKFPDEIRKKSEIGKIFCSQCSSCHGCR